MHAATILNLFENYLLSYLSLKYLVLKDTYNQYFEPTGQYNYLTLRKTFTTSLLSERLTMLISFSALNKVIKTMNKLST